MTVSADPRFPAFPSEQKTVCPVCGRAAGPPVVRPDATVIPCQSCGEYEVSGSAAPALASLSSKQRVVLSGFIRDQVATLQSAALNSNVVRDSSSWPIPKLEERATRMLALAIAFLDVDPNEADVFSPSHGRFVSASYSADASDSLRIARVLAELGYVVFVNRDPGKSIGARLSQSVAITAKGRLFFEQQSQRDVLSTRGFAAMWFDATMNDAWDQAISPAISSAGFDPVRVDRLEHINRIDDEIMLQINHSRFVVADFTGHRSGVYFEAGYALGRALPVIWTCRSDELSKLHFDIRQYNCIDWSSLDDLRKRLTNRIKATVGSGPRKISSSEFDDLLG